MKCDSCGAPVENGTCTYCGKEFGNSENDKNIIINNYSSASASTSANVNVQPVIYGKPKNKWIALLLCIFTIFGHKFYEGKIGMGILYLFTAGLFGIGWIIDVITLATKPNPYYV